MITRMADRSSDERRRILVDAVALVNRHGAAAMTPDLLTDSLSPHPADDDVAIPSVDELYASLIVELSRTHLARVAATVSRRRSLTDSLQAALLAYWDSVVAHRDEHLAVRSIQARRLSTATAPDEVDPARFSAMSGVPTWLSMVADAHQVRWELPTEQLTLLITATLEGLTLSYLASGDPAPARDVLRVLAYQIARYGRRPAKNQQH